jgi:hypothetical protein
MMIDRRTFLKSTLGTTLASRLIFAAPQSGETLYNGIVLPTPWPPQRRYPDAHPFTAPYLAEPPRVIDIDLGRQLFVDDFLIQETSLTRTFHLAEYHPASPVLRPVTEIENDDEYVAVTKTQPNPTSMVFSDGVFFDPRDRLFKMWYMAGYRRHTGLAYSNDGIAWHRPKLDFWADTNIVQRGGRDSGTVWLDHDAKKPDARFKMALFHDTTLSLHTSPDGIHWLRIGETGKSGDRTTFFYNPFRKVWVFGVRDDMFPGRGRYRRYWEHSRFEAAAGWSNITPVPWVRADERDAVRDDTAQAAELYNLDCVAYESLLLGLFTVWRGENPRREKINEVTVGYSRDGFHWTRPDRRAFLPVSDEPGAWNYANIQSAGGCCLIVGDRLHFYMSGRTGIPGTDMPGTCTTGLALLRRDGFASMDWLPDSGQVRRVLDASHSDGILVTRPLRFSGAHLFVNAALDSGELRAEVLDAQGRVIPGFELARSIPARGDATRLALAWNGASLARLAGEAVRLRFQMTRGRLYAFWVSAFDTGESRGFVAGGGPGFRGPADTREL